MSEAGDERVRLFVALELPAAAQRVLVRWRGAALQGRAELRPVAPEALHVTLCFLGWRSAEEIEPIASACRGAGTFPPASLQFTDGVWLPRRRPRVLAVGLDDTHGTLGRVQTRLSDALARGGWYEPESRPFLAHVTVARVAGRARVRAEDLPPVPPTELVGRTVTLFRSRLGRGGARYEALQSVELGERSGLAPSGGTGSPSK